MRGRSSQARAQQRWYSAAAKTPYCNSEGTKAQRGTEGHRRQARTQRGDKAAACNSGDKEPATVGTQRKDKAAACNSGNTEAERHSKQARTQQRAQCRDVQQPPPSCCNKEDIPSTNEHSNEHSNATRCSIRSVIAQAATHKLRQRNKRGHSSEAPAATATQRGHSETTWRVPHAGCSRVFVPDAIRCAHACGTHPSGGITASPLPPAGDTTHGRAGRIIQGWRSIIQG